MSSHASEAPEQKGKKNTSMCARCRHDKRKCGPPNRDWANSREKCTRCLKYDYECSESTRKKREPKGRVLSASTSSLAAVNTAARERMAEALLSDRQIIAGTRWAPRQSSPYVNHPFRPLVVPGGDMGVIANPAMDSDGPSSEYSVIDIATPPTRKTSETEARKSLAELGDQAATSQLLQSELELCAAVRDYVGEIEHIKIMEETFKATIDALRSSTRDRLARAISLKTRDMGVYKETFLSQLMFFRYCASAMANGTPFLSIENDDNLLKEWHSIQKKKDKYSVAYCLSPRIWPRSATADPIHPNSEAELVRAYSTAADHINMVLSRCVLEDAHHGELMFGPRHPGDPFSSHVLRYSACHLVIHQATPTLMLELWKQPYQGQSITWELDCLLRTPVHIAAYSSCTHILQDIFERDGKTACGFLKDRFGLTPLSIAACKDDIRSFIMLRQYACRKEVDPVIGYQDYLVQDHEGRSVLALAARNGSHKVVKWILGTGDLPPSSLQNIERWELCEAILAGHQNIVDLLVAFYNSQAFYADNEMQIQAGIAMAKKKGLDNILQQLSNIKPILPTVQDAIDSMDSIEYSSGPPNDSHDSSYQVDVFTSFTNSDSYYTDSQDFGYYSSFNDQWPTTSYDVPPLSYPPSAPRYQDPVARGSNPRYTSSPWHQTPYQQNEDPG